MALISSLYPIFVFIAFAAVGPFSHADAMLHISGENELLLSRRSIAEVTSPPQPLVDNSSFILAADRTNRKDPLNGYEHYTGGWNISDDHYWASVGYTSYPFFFVAILWLVGFGFVLFIMCCCYCYCRRRTYSYSRVAYALSLILLLLCTCAAIIGCGILYSGQGKFQRSTSNTLDYVQGQANLTVENLRNFSTSLAAAKNIDVDHIFLPADVQGRIDTIQNKLNTSANTLSSRSSNNTQKIHKVLKKVQLFLVIVAAVMLLLAFLGLVFSLLGLQCIVPVLVVIGWILVAGTFILCGVSLLFHNVVTDACVAMGDWVHHPHTHTALDDILPCVDPATAYESVNRSREVTFQLVKIVDQAIDNICNGDFPFFIPAPLNYNQSGPKVPALCSPYMPDMSDRACLAGEVSLENAPEVWQRYTCNISNTNGNEICTSEGRLTPKLYNQLTAAVRVGLGIYQYAPFLAQLADCTFVRETFTEINKNNCPGLTRYSKWVYAGLASVSAAVTLSVIFWVIHARERRHHEHSKQFIASEGWPPLGVQEKV